MLVDCDLQFTSGTNQARRSVPRQFLVPLLIGNGQAGLVITYNATSPSSVPRFCICICICISFCICICICFCIHLIAERGILPFTFSSFRCWRKLFTTQTTHWEKNVSIHISSGGVQIFTVTNICLFRKFEPIFL